MNQKLIESYALHRQISVDDAKHQITSIIQKVAHGLAPKFVFGYHSTGDIEQDAFVLALEVLSEDAYDASRPLENFLYVHLKRRLANNVRKHFYRGEPPCRCCNTDNPPKSPCKKWIEWNKRNRSKQNLMKPIDMDLVNHEHEVNMFSDYDVVDEAVNNEILLKIDRELPVYLRADYLRMRENIKISKFRRNKVREMILSIISPCEKEEKKDAV